MLAPGKPSYLLRVGRLRIAPLLANKLAWAMVAEPLAVKLAPIPEALSDPPVIVRLPASTFAATVSEPPVIASAPVRLELALTVSAPPAMDRASLPAVV